MSYDRDDIKWILTIIGLCLFVIILASACVLLVMATFPVDQETVIGEVIDVDVYDRYVEVFLKDNSSYKIKFPGDNIDLTVNSQVVMKLAKWGVLWFDDDIWDSVSIIKVPGD